MQIQPLDWNINFKAKILFIKPKYISINQLAEVEDFLYQNYVMNKLDK